MIDLYQLWCYIFGALLKVYQFDRFCTDKMLVSRRDITVPICVSILPVR